MNKMKNKVNIFLVLLLSFVIFSCEDDGYEDFDAGGTNVEEVSGEWWVVGYDTTGSPAYGGDYNLWSTYNTAANDSEMWLDDHGSFFEVKTRVQANVADLSFSGAPEATELYTGGTVTVSNGKIFKDGGLSATGVVVDSIYFEVEFDWDPGTIYTFGGHGRSGFLEDEDPHL